MSICDFLPPHSGAGRSRTRQFFDITRHLATALVIAALGLSARVSAQAPETFEGPRFDVWEYRVSGNTKLDARQIERAVYPFLGPQRSATDVEAAREQLETVYRDAGYGTVIVSIPEQDVDEGVVELEVIESKVDRLIVTESDYFSPRRIKRKAPSLAEGTVPYIPDVQADLTRLNRMSRDRRITPILRPGRTPGTVEVDLRVDDNSPLHGFFELNDRFTRNTTRTRINASLSYANLWQREHNASIGFQTAPEETDEVTSIYGTYGFAIPNTAWSMTAYAVDTASDVLTVGTLGVVGAGRIYGLRLSRLLGARNGVVHTLALGVDFKDFDESISLEDAGVIETPITYWTAGALYGLAFLGENWNTRFDFDLIVGPRFFGNDTDDFEQKRFGARANFAYLQTTITHNHQLPGGFGLRARVRGQLANSPLINNEQFTFGGVESVRGYLEAQQFVDDGLSGQFEIYSPDLGRRTWEALSLRFLTFFDFGTGRLQDPLPGIAENYQLSSAGAGLRLALWKLSGLVDYAYPFDTTPDGLVEEGDPRLHFSVRYQF